MQTKKKIRRDRIHRKRYILTSFGIAGAITAVGATANQVTAHADTVPNQNQIQGVKQYPDKEIIDRTVDQAKGQEGLNIHQIGDETLRAKNQADAHQQATDNYNKQADKINQAKDQAKQQMDAYHQDHNNWDKEKQKFDQDTEKYNQDKAKYESDKAANEQKNKEIDNNNAEIDRENEAARNKYQQDLDKYNQDKVANEQKNKEIDNNNAEIDRENAAAKQKYQQELDKYNQDKANADAQNQQADKDYQDALAKYQQDLDKYNRDKANADSQNQQSDKNYQDALAKYQQDLNKYNQAQQNTDAHNAQVDRDNAAAQAQYQSDLADYAQRLNEYNQKINGQPTVATGNNSVKLVGHTGSEKSINYYSGMSISADASAIGASALNKVSWNERTQIIGANGKASLDPKQYGQLNPSDNINNFYDITNVVRNGGTIKLTNVTTDNYGVSYDMKLTFTNTETTSETAPSKVIIGRAGDDSIEFDYYGGFRRTGINISDIQFVYSYTDAAVPVFVNSLFSDIDVGQGFSTNFGNKLSWTPSNSYVKIRGDDVSSTADNGAGANYGYNWNLRNGYSSASEYTDWDGFNSAPYGTLLLAGAGDHFYFNYHSKGFASDVNFDDKKGYDGGIQFNLFGDGASLATTPTPPTPPTLEQKSKNNVPKPTPPTPGSKVSEPEKPTPPTPGPKTPEPTPPTTNQDKPHQERVPFTETPPSPSQDKPHQEHVPFTETPPTPNQDKPHQEHIPFTETPPVPPKPLRPEPQTPKPVDVDYHYVVYDYNSNVHKDFTNKAGGVTNNQFYIDGSTIYAQITGELPDSRQMSKDQPLTAFEVRDDGSQYANKAKFAGADILIDGQNHNGDFAVTDRGNNVITFTLKNLSLAQGQKFVVIPRWTVSADAQPGDITNVAHVVTNGQDQGSVPVTEHNYKPTIHKDVLSGVSDADKGASIDGQTVANGTVMTFPLTFNEPLPANRAQKIDSTIWNDQLDPHFQYQSYRAFINQNGQKLDVTSHVHLTQNGQQLTWQDDDFLHNYLNSHMGEAVTMPWIDLTVKAVGDNVQLIPNQFDITQVVEDPSGKVDVKTSSNIVHISTYQPKTHKDVELGEVDGDTPASIDGQTVIAGSTITYPMTVTDLPANRSQNVAKSEWTDTLDPNVEYVGYKAFLPGADGSLADVSSNIHVTQSGQVLTITDDDDLRAKLNGDKSQAQKQVIIDVYVRVKNTHQVIPNVFTFKQTFDDPDGGNPTETTDTSNKVTVDVYQAQPVKDVQVGTVTGSDSTKSVNGKLIPTGQSVTFPLTIKDPLPAHRVQKVTKTAWRDTLDQNLKYSGFAASIKLPNGQTVNLKDHIHVEQVGRTLIFTADDYLNGLMNLDLNLKQELPVIDVYATMTGTAKEAKNVYTFEQTYTDGNGHVTTKEESNVVTVHTPAKPQPAKTVTDAAGHNINGQETKAGVNYQYHLDWDLTKYQKIVASPEMIKKGFFFIDPINTKAIMLGDLSKATVTDMSGHVVPGMTIRKYTSISQLPKYIQDQIRENHLENQLGDEFLMAIANDPQKFYTNYVQKGARLKVNFPYQVRPGFVGKYSNTAYQFGFGIATPTNTVTNYVKPVPKPTPKPAPAPTPAPAPAPQQARLPQTGNTSSMMPVYFGLTALVSALGYGLLEVLKMLGLM